LTDSLLQAMFTLKFICYLQSESAVT